MEHEREKGNLSRCLRLAQEREELERELRRYTQNDDFEEASMWESRSNTLPHKANSQQRPGSFSSASLHWEAYRLASLPPTPIPHLTRFGSVSPSCFQKERLARTPASREEAERFCQDGRLTLPRLPSKRKERVAAVPEGLEKSTNSTTKMRTGDSCYESRRQNNHSFTMLPFHSEKYPQRCHSVIGVLPTSSKVPNEDVEMSVDEPNLDRLLESTPKPMLHQRIASHVQNGCALSRKEQFHTIRRSKSLNSRSPVRKGEDVKRPMSPPAALHESWARLPAKNRESKRRSQSLDSRRRKDANFLTPDAWINSLSQENCADIAPQRPTSLVWDTRGSPERAKSPANSYKTQMNSPQQRLPTNHLSNGYYEHDYNYHKAMKAAGRYLDAIKNPFLEDDGRYFEHEEEEEGYRAVPESGSYSSYASSGRGSMDPPNNRLSLCHMSPTLRESPARMEDRVSGHMDHSHRRKESVDENYEWDAADVCSQVGEHDGLLPPLPLQKPALSCSPPRTHLTSSARRICSDRTAPETHHGPAPPQPEAAVLF